MPVLDDSLLNCASDDPLPPMDISDDTSQDDIKIIKNNIFLTLIIKKPVHSLYSLQFLQ